MPTDHSLDVSGITASNKNEVIKTILRDVVRYNAHLPTAISQRLLDRDGLPNVRAVDLLDSIFKNAIAYLLLKPEAARGDKGKSRTKGIKKLINQIEDHAEFLGVKFLTSSFQEGSVNYWLERADQRLFGDGPYKEFLNWVKTEEKKSFKDHYAAVSSKLNYLQAAALEKYEVHIEQHLIKNNDGNLITTSGTASYSQLQNAWIYVCSAKTWKLYSGPSEPGQMHHSSFLSGEPVICAGDWIIDGGKLVFMNTESGHYRPGGGNLRSFFNLYGGSLYLNTEAWVQPIMHGPVFKLVEFAQKGGKAKPDEAGQRYLAEHYGLQIITPSTYDDREDLAQKLAQI